MKSFAPNDSKKILKTKVKFDAILKALETTEKKFEQVLMFLAYNIKTSN